MKSAATNIVYFLSFVSFFTAMCCLLMNKSSLVSVSEKYLEYAKKVKELLKKEDGFYKKLYEIQFQEQHLV
jgi:hypothetical protein